MGRAGQDWRDAGAYAWLRAGDRRAFAWEWLRRTPAYRDAVLTGRDPAAFGLLRFEDPSLDALAARPFWSAAADPAVLPVFARPADGCDPFDLARFDGIASVMAGPAAEHILLSDGLRSIRVDVVAGTLARGAAAVTWRIEGLAGAGPRLDALRQLAALARHGRFARSLHRPERRAPRWIAMLRVHDAIAAGASYREIVAGLFGVTVPGPGWRETAGPWRLRVQRLAAAGRKVLAAGPGAWFGDETRCAVGARDRA